MKRAGIARYTPGRVYKKDGKDYTVIFGGVLATYHRLAFELCSNECDSCKARFVCFTNTRVDVEVTDPIVETFRRLSARFNSRCRGCDIPLKKGKDIWWSPAVRGAFCMGCGVPKITLRDV